MLFNNQRPSSLPTAKSLEEDSLALETLSQAVHMSVSAAWNESKDRLNGPGGFITRRMFDDAPKLVCESLTSIGVPFQYAPHCGQFRNEYTGEGYQLPTNLIIWRGYMRSSRRHPVSFEVAAKGSKTVEYLQPNEAFVTSRQLSILQATSFLKPIKPTERNYVLLWDIRSYESFDQISRVRTMSDYVSTFLVLANGLGTCRRKLTTVGYWNLGVHLLGETAPPTPNIINRPEAINPQINIFDID